jgi:basic membrane protein A
MKKTTKWLALFLTVIMALSLVACGGDTKKTEAEKTDAPAADAAAETDAPEKEEAKDEPEAADDAADADKKEVKVALVLPGTINDEGWNATAYRGLMKIEEELGLETSCSEMVKMSDYTQVYRNYADSGFNLIIGHGFEFFDPAEQVHESYPDTWFAVTSTNKFKAPNVCSINTNGTHAGFLNGVLAAKMTKSKIVATIGGLEIPGVAGYIYGFIEGVKYVDPTIDVRSTYTGSFEDVAQMKEVTNQMIQEGADVISPNADQAGIGGFQAVNELPEDKECWILGVYDDQSALAPGRVLVSSIIDMAMAIEQTAEKVADGTIEPKSYMFGIREGAVYLTEFNEAVPQEARDAVMDAYKKIQDGELDCIRPEDETTHE